MLPRVGLGLALLSACVPAAANPDRKPVPVYTNEDLERIRPFRGETGVTSTPVVARRAADEEPSARSQDHGEAYWRREAERLQDRLAPMAEQANRLRARLAGRSPRPGSRGPTEAQIAAWQAEIARIETRMRTLEERLQDRARREGALPGWLR